MICDRKCLSRGRGHGLRVLGSEKRRDAPRTRNLFPHRDNDQAYYSGEVGIPGCSVPGTNTDHNLDGFGFENRLKSQRLSQ